MHQSTTRKLLRRLGFRDAEIWIELSVPLPLAPLLQRRGQLTGGAAELLQQEGAETRVGLADVDRLDQSDRDAWAWPEALARRGA